MAKRTLLTLAHTYKPTTKTHIGGWYVSEKLDGMRCFWDGGISRGLPKSHVPWANTAKDERYVVAPIATGLWSRLGNVIHAPNWWLDRLPAVPLDGELYREGHRQELMSAVKKLKPTCDMWEPVEYKVFDMVPLDHVLRKGVIDVPNYYVNIGSSLDTDCLDYLPKKDTMFETTYKLLAKYAQDFRHTQIALPFALDAAKNMVDQYARKVVAKGGEGVIIKCPTVSYLTERSHHTLKVKPVEDMEGTVVGYISGKETDKGSKLLGMMGSLSLRLDNGQPLSLSGFTDIERTLNDPDWAAEHPGKVCPRDVESIHFPRGSRVTFTYRGLTADGIPQEARYLRRRVDV